MERGKKLRLVDADALLKEYDRVHVGEPGMARKLIQEAPTIDPKPKWTPATEPPKAGRDVLVTRLVHDNVRYVDIASYQDDCWMGIHDEYEKPCEHKVIAWQPLPKSWKGKG